jgi:starvation-inducible DNA-binding protein
MKPLAATPAKTKSDSVVVKGLNLLVADSYALMANTHVAHWNVEGPGFFSLHKAFHEQYEDLFEAIDEIAERIRALDAYAAGGLRHFFNEAGMDEFKSPASAKDYVAGLVLGHEKAIADAVSVRDAANHANDLETQDLVIKRIQTHEKTLWMLKSYLKTA